MDASSGTLFFRLMLRLLGADHPIRLASGVALGILIKMLLDATAAALPNVPFLVRIADYQMIWFILVSSPALFIPLIWGRRGASEPVVHAINTFEAVLHRANFSKTQQSTYWHALLNKLIANVTPNRISVPDAQALAREAEEEASGSADTTRQS